MLEATAAMGPGGPLNSETIQDPKSHGFMGDGLKYQRLPIYIYDYVYICIYMIIYIYVYIYIIISFINKCGYTPHWQFFKMEYDDKAWDYADKK